MTINVYILAIKQTKPDPYPAAGVDGLSESAFDRLPNNKLLKTSKTITFNVKSLRGSNTITSP